MNLSYRTRRNLRRMGKLLLIAAIVGTLVWLCWMVWVARFIIYDRDFGALLDFDLGPFPEGVLAAPPTEGDPVDIFYNEPNADTPDVEVVKTSIQGYYVNLSDLQKDIPSVQAKLEALPAGTAVLIDVKSPKGYFYYSSDITDSATTTTMNTEQMDALIEYLAASDLHLIARLPAFRDWRYGLNHVPSGLPLKNGDGALWMDGTGCYWLDPTDEQAMNYLVRITKELQSLGFDEVVFDDFCFPSTDKVRFPANMEQAIVDAAATLATACATEQFCVSFITKEPTFPLPTGNCRVYLQGVAAEDAETVAQQVATDDPALHVLFMTTTSDASDTRFNKYCVLRPLESAH
jgi:hypothetical protein